MTDTLGVDYSDGRPGGKALAAAGISFAARYLSHNEDKNLTPGEAADLAAHGVSCVVVWETTANRAGDGRAAGIADAGEAAAQAKTCGQPAGRPIFFAVDWDAAPSVVVPYFEGVVSVLGLARTGVYGGYRVADYLLDHQLAAWAWQTVAWSAGRWDPRAVIRQYASTVRIGGVTCDKNTATATDYGQWTPGQIPHLEEDMPITKADAQLIAGTVAAYKNPTIEPKGPDLRQRVVNAEAHSADALAQARANGSALTALAGKVDKLTAPVTPTIDYAKLAAALIAAVKES